MRDYIDGSAENRQAAEQAIDQRHPARAGLLKANPRLLNNPDHDGAHRYNVWVLPPTALVVESLRFLPPQAEILDVGCDIGRHALYLASLGHKVTAIDKTDEFKHLMFEAGRERGVPIENINFLDVDITDPADKRRLLTRKPSFQTVIASSVLHFMTDQEVGPAVNYLRRLTDPAGLNVVSVYTTDNPIEEQGPDRGLKRFFEPGELADYYQDWLPRVTQEHPHHSIGTAGLMFRQNGLALIPTTEELIARQPLAATPTHTYMTADRQIITV